MSNSEDSTITYTEAPLSPDYVLGPEHPPSLAYVSEFVSEPVCLEFMPPEDNVLPAEEQPLPAAVSSTANSSRYISEFDSEEDPKEDPEEDDEDPKEDPADYTTDKEEDDDDKEEEEPSRDDADDEDGDKEEHLAPADSIP
nr:hypothetical protein [Tanacetum cinerariifolium]GFA75373.1 hypothetical protein [Tanacetum cinerariifolium]